MEGVWKDGMLAAVLRAALESPGAMRYVEGGSAVLVSAQPGATVALRGAADFATLEHDGRALERAGLATEWERDDRYDVTVYRATAKKTAATVVVPRVAG
jgi:hypothetical protein